MLICVDQNFLVAIRRDLSRIGDSAAVDLCDRIRDGALLEPEIAALVTNWRQDGQTASLYRLADAVADLNEDRSETLAAISHAAERAAAYRHPMARSIDDC